MPRVYVPTALRRRIVDRAQGIREYCLFPETLSSLRLVIDHVIAAKHGGLTESENLANACVFCNSAKGSDIGSIHWPSGEFVRLFNPRADRWSQHFRLSRSRIEGVSAIGIVIAKLLEFNRLKRLQERRLFIKVGMYPDRIGKKRMSPLTGSC